MKCENCGNLNASLVWSGYSRPLPDVDPTYSEWEEYWLCQECMEDIRPAQKGATG